MFSRPILYSLLCVTASALITVAARTPVEAGQLQASPATYRSLLARLQPGDELILEPGTYREGLPLHDIRGTVDRPIRILGPQTGLPAVFIGRSGHNTVSLSNTAYVRLGHLILDGRNLEVDAVKAEGSRACSSVHHVVLEDLLIVGHGADQQVVGISSMCPAWNWVIRRNVIIGAGTGLYLGQSDGSAPFVGGLIEQNMLIDTRGYNLQIKHQTKRPMVAGMPSQTTRTVIRHNLFVKARNASIGVEARPNVLLGHFPKEGPGSEDVYEVTNNIFFCSPGESLLQAEGNLHIGGNILINPAGDAISVQPHHDLPRHVAIENNFIVASGRAISIVKASPLHAQPVRRNRVFTPSPLAGGQQEANQTADFPASDASMVQWATTRQSSDAMSHRTAFNPLLEVATRACSVPASANASTFGWPHDSLRDHPVCNLVELLAAAPKTPAKAGRSSSRGAAVPQGCEVR